MKKSAFLGLGLPLVLALLACLEFSGCKASTPAASTAVINFDLQTNSCGTTVTLDGGHPATLIGNQFFADVYTNVPLGAHVIGVAAAGASISCPETILITDYSVEIITPCTNLNCGNVQPE